jgi:hypothetical protein
MSQRFYDHELNDGGKQYIFCDTPRKFGRFEMEDGKVTLPENMRDKWQNLMSWVWSQLEESGRHGYIHVWSFVDQVEVCISVYRVTARDYERLDPSRARLMVTREPLFAKELSGLIPRFE